MSRITQLQFDTGTWLKDPALSMCEPATRGIWIDILCAMHENNRCGQLIGTHSELSRICRCTEGEIKTAITELKQKKAADVTEFIQEGSNAIVTVVNRRMKRDFDIKTGAAVRQQKFRDNNRNLPTSDAAKIMADIFRRRHDTPWDDKEIVAFRGIGKIDIEELQLIQKFYKASVGNEKAWLRTGLQAFCNNYRGEADKARTWAHKNPKTANGSNGNHKDIEPEGFRDWLKETYPVGNHAIPWKDVTDSTRKDFNEFQKSR